ncbi:hypothetical protein, partial [Campylobacter coli]|uniref:hypothetical protein n=1 Tax=Campylobacter coli TaxID=195 RepID=UPI001C2D6785
AIVGAHMRNMGKLKQNTIVATVMSNLGLFLFGEKEKIHIEKTRNTSDFPLLETIGLFLYLHSALLSECRRSFRVYHLCIGHNSMYILKNCI